MSLYQENQMTDTPTHRYHVDLTDEQAVRVSEAFMRVFMRVPSSSPYGQACVAIASAIMDQRQTPLVKGDRVRLKSENPEDGLFGTMGEPMGPKVLVDWGDDHVSTHYVNKLVRAEA